MKKAIPLLLLIAIFSCSSENTEQLTTLETTTQVKVEKPKAELWNPVLDGFGTLTYYQKADITSSVDGIIENLKREEGDPIRRGQSLCTLSNIQMQLRHDQAEIALNAQEASLSLAETQYEEARKQVEAQFLGLEKSSMQIIQKGLELQQLEKQKEQKESLFAIGGIPPQELETLELNLSALKTSLSVMEKDKAIQEIGFRIKDLTEAGYDIPTDQESLGQLYIDLNTRIQRAQITTAMSSLEFAKGELESSRQLLEELNLTTPLTGIVAARYKERGERVKANDKIMTVFDTSKVYAVFPLQEKELSNVRIGQTVELSIDALKEKAREGKIHLISPAIDPKSGSFTVKAIVDNPRGDLRPGMFFRVKIPTSSPRTVLTIPKEDLVLRRKEKGQVYVWNQNRVFLTDIVLGEEHSGMIPVLEGLEEDQWIVKTPSPLLTDKQEVLLENS